MWYLSRVVFNMGVVLGGWCGSSLGLWGGGVWFELYGGGGSVVCQGCWGLKGEVWLLIVCFLCVGGVCEQCGLGGFFVFFLGCLRMQLS